MGAHLFVHLPLFIGLFEEHSAARNRPLAL
jgi:hypothetical protein